MNKANRAIVPQQPPELHPRPRGHQPPVIVVYKSPQQLSEHRPSHYQPSPGIKQRPLTQLHEFAEVLMFLALFITTSAVLALSIVHLGNAIFWNGERMSREIYNYPGD
ncbi:hypothetical protein SPB21_02180 [Leptothoe sp. ISB3NOV94-8A]